ncbi:division/cell wall cluster transcriptional repressor MraZ [Altererythrobacter aestiaquae]|uniref:Division/cell wall cluster transcriptional repressor MraZ n=1 Tax=Pontixanthobacter aestiaquae TaxID=1509367 RepID=A0A844Z2P9_9SPHN|nr:division/cell wall cluster transcriptional repressor MraZ [Pontixanthobacter aestiaquae]
MRHSYSGQALTLLGDKDRFVIPPEFRKIVRASSDDKRILCLAKHDRWDCLVGFGLSRQEELEEQLDREEDAALRLGRDYDRELRSNLLFGFERIPFDDSGRFTMPDYLRSDGQIDDTLFFRGAGQSFTVWNPAVLEQQGSEWNPVKSSCAGLVKEAEAKGKGQNRGKRK